MSDARGLSSSEPLDHPSRRNHRRLYVALTNHCNRACPWCSVHASPSKSTFMTAAMFSSTLADFAALDPRPFDLQLEGGEPTTHPTFWDFVATARQHPQVRKIVLCTNGVLIPADTAAAAAFVERLGAPVMIKLSINHYLLKRDRKLLLKAHALHTVIADDLVLNVRRRRGPAYDDDRAVLDAVTAAGLLPRSNDFFLQRYGLAAGETAWDEPFLAGHGFTMVNPDGSHSGTDLFARSAAMEALP